MGYAQNPLKVYYCYDLGEEGEEEEERGSSPRLKNCIAEVTAHSRFPFIGFYGRFFSSVDCWWMIGLQVTNTPWGEKVFFEFVPGSDMVAKPLHVSPFMVRNFLQVTV